MAADLDVKVPISGLRGSRHELRISLSARLFDNATDTLWADAPGKRLHALGAWAFPALVFALSRSPRH